MKQREFFALGLLILGLTGWLIWFAVSSLPQMKDIEARETYLQSLDWYVEPEENTYFSYLDFGNENLICRKWIEYDKESNQSIVLQGVITPNGEEIVSCRYYEIVYYGGDYFAAVTEEEWTVFDFNGDKITSLPTEQEHLYYAGGTYFVRYPDFKKMGFEIVDGMTGKVKKAFPNAYNGRKLPDGTWYICEKPDNGGFDRFVFGDEMGVMFGYEYFEEAPVVSGYYLDEELKPMYDGRKYFHHCSGEGLYIASRIVDGIVSDCVLLDGNRELVEIPKHSPLYVQVEASSIAASDGAYGLVMDKDGNLGLVFQRYHEDFGTARYYDDYGQELYEVETDPNPYTVKAVEYDRFQVVDEEGNVVLEPWFVDIQILSGGKAAEVVVDDRHGIVKMKGVE